MASVSGIRSRQTVPSPASDSTSIVPPMASMLVLTTSMPTPRPDTLVTAAAVEKPGRKIICRMSCGLIRWSASALIRPRSAVFSGALAGGEAGLRGLVRLRGRVDARAVVGDLDHDLAALVLRAQGEDALGRLA